MSSDGSVGPTHGGAAPDWMGYNNGPWDGFRQEWVEFKKDFAVGANFSMAVMGAGLNLVTAGAKGQVKSNFG